MPTYRISYKTHYLEHSEYGHEDVEADSEGEALKAFVNGRLSELEHIEDYDGPDRTALADMDPSQLKSWWEGDWLVVFRGIHQTDMVTCPACQGQGEVREETAQQLLQRTT